ncbi:MAG TPA: DUF373 family protein [Candidatus Methanofastidiosa archaeon]|nr:DUF373 family protein [Candidatus Methanofastidiosa archaeon]
MVDKILVLGVDRDNDIGDKTGIGGPILGRVAVQDAALKLGIADPTESDTNVLFHCIKLYDRLVKEGKETYISIVTGDRSVGIRSDMIISDQLDKIIEEYGTKSVILVSDGKEDENILPIIQSKMAIVSIERVTVQQSESLEDTYFILHTYLKRMMDDRKVSGLFLGIPGIIIIIYGLTYIFPEFTKYGWFAAFSILGLYLFLKGFGIDDYLKDAITPKRINLIAYSVAMVIALYGGYEGFKNIHWSIVPYINWESAKYVFTAFFDGSFPLMYVGIIAALAGNVISAYSNNKQRFWSHMSVFIGAFAIFGNVYQYTSYVQNEITRNEVMFSFVFITFVAIMGIVISLLGRSKAMSPEKKRRMPLSRRGIITLFVIALLIVTGMTYFDQGTPVVVDSDPSFSISTNLADQENVSMGVVDDKIYTVWQDNRDGNWEIYIKYLDSGEVENITNNQYQQVNPMACEDRIVWEDNRNGNWDIYMYYISTDILVRVTDNEYDQINPDIDGNWIVWEDERNGNADIYLYDVTNSEETRITVDETGFQPFQTSPRISDGTIVWLDNRNGEFNIFSYDIANETETAVTSGRSIKFNPEIDGDTIVWEDNRNGNWDIYMYDLEEGDELQLTSSSDNQVNPTVNEYYICWDDDSEGNTNIYVYRREDGSVLQVTDLISDQEAPYVMDQYMVWIDWRNDLDGIETGTEDDNPDIYGIELDDLWNTE